MSGWQHSDIGHGWRLRASWLAVLAALCVNAQLRITGRYCASLSPARLAGLVLSAGQMGMVGYRPQAGERVHRGSQY